MSDQIPANAMIESQPTTESDSPIVATKTPDGKEMVDLGVLIAERKSGKEKLEAKRKEWETTELEPLKTKAAQADQLARDLEALGPQLKYLQEHPELLQQAQPPAVQQVSDEDAEKYARRYELYTSSGLDVQRAKKIIADNRDETRRIATEAAQQAAAPAIQAAAVQQARNNFAWAISQRTPDGRAMADPTILQTLFANVPPELAANQQVAQHLLTAAIGETVRQGKIPTAPLNQEPTFTEAAGGGGRSYQMGDMEKRLAANTGIKEADWQKTAQKFDPGARLNVLGD